MKEEIQDSGKRSNLADEGLLALVARLQGPVRDMELRWLECLWEMAAVGEAAAVPLAGTAAGRLPLSRGQGGDITVKLDQVAEEAMLAVLSRRAPEPCRVVSEEVGELPTKHIDSPPQPDRWLVLIDPVDGSLNAKRGLEPFGCTIAVAKGATLGDVILGLVADYTRGHRFLAVRGLGMAATREVNQPPAGAEVELILTEMGRPEYAVFSFQQIGLLAGTSHSDFRVRQIGSLALALALTALGVADVLFCPAPARTLDIAAGALILEEAGGGLCTLNEDMPLHLQPLDLVRRAPFVAWRPGLDGTSIAERARQLWSCRPSTAMN